MLGAVAFACTAMGCATVSASSHPATFRNFGSVDDAAREHKEVLATFEGLREDPPVDRLAAVKVLKDTIPEGIQLENGTIAVKPGYPYVVRGTFTLAPGSASTFGFADYDPGWRKGLCYPQVPLTWATLGMWQLFVPLSYPCAGGGLKRDVAIQQVRALAVAAGANLVLLRMQTDAEGENVGRVEGVLLHADPTAAGGPADPRRGTPSEI